MAGKFKVEGIEDLDKALAELGRRTGLATIYRALEKVGRPIRDDMQENAPEADGSLKDSVRMIRASADRTRQGKAAFSAALADGASVGEARGALRSTVGALNAAGPTAEVIIGPGRHPQAVTNEFGTGERFHADGKSVGRAEAQPFMRPAWDAHSGGLEAELGRILGAEIEKSARRVAARAARLAKTGR